MAEGKMQTIGWQLVGTEIAKTVMPLPNDYNELIVQVGEYSFSLCKAQLPSAGQYYRNGYNFANQNNLVTINVGKNYVKLENLIVNGSDVTSTASISVYCR